VLLLLLYCGMRFNAARVIDAIAECCRGCHKFAKFNLLTSFPVCRSKDVYINNADHYNIAD